MAERDSVRTGGLRATSPGCSCDLLLTLSTRDPVRALLAVERLSHAEILSAQQGLHDHAAPEPADWRVRLAQRGASAGDLEQLLAIVRSADSHAYQLLEHAGVCCARLRRQVIEQLRELGGSGLREGVVLRGADLDRRPTKMTRARHSGDPSERPTRTPRVSTALRPRPSIEPSASAREPVARAEPRTVRTLQPRHRPQSQRDAQPEPEPSEDVLPASRPRLAPIDVASLAPLHGRERDLPRLADALMRRSPRAPLLVGPHGSGRTLLAMHLAHVVPHPVFRLDATGYEDEDALRDDLEIVAEAGGIAVFDDLDRVPAETAPPFLGALTQTWSRGRPPIVTIASAEGHARLAMWAPGAMQTVDVLTIDPLTGPALVAAVGAAAPSILNEHGLELAPDAKLGELTRMADRYLGGLAMPARALDLLDLSCARSVREGHPHVRRSTWIDIVSERSGLPPERIEVRGDQDILDLEHKLARSVVGHDHVTRAIAQLIRRNRAGFGSSRPVATVLLLGPSGVGKTEIAKALCGTLFERPDALVRLDMSEYAESHAVARIVGAPPGYVGHEQGGALTDPLLQRPHCVVLLDEIEKAHRDVHQLLLQVFDEGRLTDGRGRTVDFRHAVVIMTSNLGADQIHASPGGGVMIEDEVLEAARKAFPVELWNRIEAPLVMQPLDPDAMAQICRRLARSSSDRLFRERGIRYALSDQACGRLVALAGRDPALGARPLRHLLTREVEATIADAILRGQLRAGTQIEVHHDRGRFRLR
jgi:ATP-dependent Clp protease ATP-binding subunit ClpC